jgi:hypothetical protein
MIVAVTVSLRDVHVTLRASARTWPKNVIGPTRFFGGEGAAVSEAPVGVFMTIWGLDGTV